MITTFRPLPKLVLLLALAAPVFAQKGEGPIDPAPPKGHTPDEIINIVAQKEKEFQQARDRYVYRQDVKINELEGNTVVGEYRSVSDVTFDDRGRRAESVVFAPQNTLQRVIMNQEDKDDIENHFPFVLTSDTRDVYDIKYVGHQKVDELGTYVFDLNPVRLQKGKRYFKGRIWVDDQDLMIVKTSGVGYPNSKDNTPLPFTTWREQIDGKYWFPTYTSGQVEVCDRDKHGVCKNVGTPIAAVVKYTDYKQYKATSTITFGEEVPDPNQPQQPQQQQQQQPGAKPKK
jgi:hypothetical protein